MASKEGSLPNGTSEESHKEKLEDSSTNNIGSSGAKVLRKKISSEPISISQSLKEKEKVPLPSSLGRTPIFQIGELDTSSDSNSSTSSPVEIVHFVFPDVSKESNNNSSTSGNTSCKGNNTLIKPKPGYLGGHYNYTSPSNSHLNSLSALQAQQHGHGEDNIVLPVSSRKISTSSSNDCERSKKMWNFSRRQWLTLVVFAFVEFFSAIVISLQAPFYPAEAEKKGASATEYGFVFGVFELTAFIVSPIYGAYMRPIGPKLVFNLGIFVTATCSILFGLLDKVEMRTEFIALSMLTRVFEALGDAAFVTASFVIIASEFPDSVATTFATMETFYGFGLIVGPTVGGALYQWGGYTLPFTTIGSLLFITALMTYFVMPSSLSLDGDDRESNSEQSCFAIFKLLRVPSIAMSAFAIVSASMSVGFLSATLEPSLRQFNLSPVVTGVIFISSGGMYACTAPIIGYICDKTTRLHFIMQMGSILIIIGFLLIGPAPFIPIESNLWIVVLGLVIHGIGLGAALVAGFVAALREAAARGFPDNVSTYGVVSSIWTSMFALGSFIGPSVAGVLFDIVGFPAATLFVVGVHVVGATLSTYFVCWSKGVTTDEEKNFLLRKSSQISIANEQTNYGSAAS